MSNSFRFVHAADIHLDSPLLGLEEFEDAPLETIRNAAREAVRRLVQLCIDEHVAFLLIAGDVYDGEWKSLATGRFFAGQMARLNDANIPVVLIKGNHDAASKISSQISLPGVTVLDTRRPMTVELLDGQVAVHGQSYSRPDTTENLAAKYPTAAPGKFNIGLLHTCATTSTSSHANYAPCSLQDLISKGYDYWALGHVHQRAILHKDPPIVFPGNIQGRHVRESAEEGKGVTMVEVIDGAIHSFNHVPLDTVRWVVLEIDVTECESIENVQIAVRSQVNRSLASIGDRLLAARIVLKGSSPASSAILKDPGGFDAALRGAIESQSDSVWLEEIQIRVWIPEAETPDTDQGALNELLNFVRSAEGELDAPKQRLQTLCTKLEATEPGLVRDMGLDDPNLLSDLLPEVESLIRALSMENER